MILPAGSAAMTSNATILNVKCYPCQEPLIHLTRSETDDFVFCPNCGGILSYEEVVKNSAGLVGGMLTIEELNRLRVEAGLDPK
jgi:ribosomal protein S27E